MFCDRLAVDGLLLVLETSRERFTTEEVHAKQRSMIRKTRRRRWKAYRSCSSRSWKV